jgi:ribonuclease Z
VAGVAANSVTRLCLSHFYGDHCLGVPGIAQRLSRDRVHHPIPAHPEPLPGPHTIDAIGYRLVEPNGRRFVPELLAHHGSSGPAAGALQLAIAGSL